MNVEVVVEAVMAIGNIIVIVFIVGIFIADQPAAALTGRIEISEAAAAEGQMCIAFIVIPEDALAAMVTNGGQFVNTGFTVDAIMEMVFLSRFQDTAAVVANIVAHIY